MAEELSSQLLDDFLEGQLQVWPMAKKNYEALKEVRTRSFEVEGWPIRVQFNPGRIQSSGAKVDKKSLEARPCFLCQKNRPLEQEFIPWREYQVLINPFPIFPRHFTIPTIEHTPQTILGGRIRDMVDLAMMLKEYIVFYNGPRCGASAPDHMHFQAGNADFLTIHKPLEKATMRVVATAGNSVLKLSEDIPMTLFTIETSKAEEAEKLFDRLIAALNKPQGETEPMMNILCSHIPGTDRVRIIVIPRLAHRPSFYGTTGGGAMLISPASVDMGGTFITPLEADFHRLSPEIVMQIFQELVISQAQAEEVADRIEKGIANDTKDQSSNQNSEDKEKRIG